MWWGLAIAHWSHLAKAKSKKGKKRKKKKIELSCLSLLNSVKEKCGFL